MDAHYSYKDSVVEAIKEVDYQKFQDCGTAIANLAYGYGIPLEFQLFLFHHEYMVLMRTLDEAYKEDKENLLSLPEICDLIEEKVSEWTNSYGDFDSFDDCK